VGFYEVGNNKELEIKFHISDLPGLERRLQALGATCSQVRLHEVNLRFDTPDGSLASGSRVLRLRQDNAARLTYKGPTTYEQGVRVRTEIEFVVDDFDAARLFLEALGYQVVMTYEKYRTTYEMGGTHITLDEMPYGNFMEIEGPDSDHILAVNAQLGLDWERRVPDSYTVIFDHLRQTMGWSFQDLSFKDFEGLEFSLEGIGIHPADR